MLYNFQYQECYTSATVIEWYPAHNPLAKLPVVQHQLLASARISKSSNYLYLYIPRSLFQTISIMWSTKLMHLIKQNCIVFCAAHTLVSCFVFWMCVCVNMWVCVHCVAFSTFFGVRATVLPDTLSAPNIALKVRGHHQLLPKRPGVVKWKMESL